MLDESFEILLQFLIRTIRENNVRNNSPTNDKVVIDLNEYAVYLGKDIKYLNFDALFEEVNEDLHVLMSFSIEYEFDHGESYGKLKLIDNYVGNIYKENFIVQFTETFTKLFVS